MAAFASWIASAAPGLGASSTILLVLSATAQANASVVVLVVLGATFAFKGVFDSKGFSDLGKLVYHVSLPCLLFSKILFEFSIGSLEILWVLPLSCFLHVVSGYALGYLGAWALGMSAMERQVSTACMMFGNVGALAIAVVDSLCHSRTLIEAVGSQQTCSSLGTSYIAFYLIAQNVLMFTWGESLMGNVSDEEEPEAKQPASALVDGAKADDVERAGAPGPAAQQGADEEVDIADDGSVMPEGEEDEEHILCRVSRSPAVPIGNSMLEHEQQGLASSLGGPLARESFSLKLGQSGLKHVQSYLALEADHTHAAIDSPTVAQMAEALRHYSRRVFGDAPANREGGAEGAGGEAKPDESKEGALGAPLLGERDADATGEDGVRAKAAAWAGTRARVAVDAVHGACLWSYVLMQRLAKTPVIQAASAAMLLAAVPPIKALFVPTAAAKDAGSQPPLFFAFDAVHTLGNAQVPVSMLMLSGAATLRFMTKLRKRATAKAVEESQKSVPGHLSHASSLDASVHVGEGDIATGDPATFTFSPKFTAHVLLGRTVVMPLAGLAWWWALKRLRVIPSIEGHTALLELVVLIEAAVPTAQNVVMLLLVHREMEKGEALAQLVLWQMGVSIVAFTVACTFFQWLVL